MYLTLPHAAACNFHRPAFELKQQPTPINGASSNTCNATKQALEFDTTKTDNRYNLHGHTSITDETRNIQVRAEK